MRRYERKMPCWRAVSYTHLVEKVDFKANGKEESAWVTVDTKPSAGKVIYTNTSKPDAPKNVTIAATGNETLTAAWDSVEKADGYRVTLYYQEGSTWKDVYKRQILKIPEEKRKR